MNKPGKVLSRVVLTFDNHGKGVLLRGNYFLQPPINHPGVFDLKLGGTCLRSSYVDMSLPVVR